MPGFTPDYLYPTVTLAGQTQRFSFESSLSQFQLSNLFSPTALNSSQNCFEFINVNSSGYRIRQLTSNTGQTGDFILEKFSNGTIPGSSLFSVKESSGHFVFSPQTGGALELNNGSSIIPLQFFNSTGTHYAALQAGNLLSNVSWTLPLADSTGTQALVSNGGGLLSWQSLTAGTVTSVSGVLNRTTVTNPTTTPVIDIASTYVGQSSLTTLGTITTGTWNGSIIGFSYGGTNANLTAVNGGIVYSTASAMAISAAPTTTNTIFMGQVGASPQWSASTYPSNVLSGQLLYGSSSSAISGLTTAANGTLITDSGGVPSISSTLPTAVQSNITTLGTITTGTWNGSIIGILYGGTGASTASGALTNLGAAPNNATYIVQTTNASLTNAQVLASLSTGIVKNTTTTGVLSIATAGTDYYSPGNPTTLLDDSNLSNADNNLGVGSFCLNSFSFNNSSANILNTAISPFSLYSFTTGIGNTSVGTNSGLNFVSGSHNCFLGTFSGVANVNYNNCTLIGNSSDTSVNNLTNAIAIGYLSSVATSNTIVLGNTSITSLRIPGINLGFTLNTISSLNTNGNINVTPNGTGITIFTNNVGFGTSAPHSVIQTSNTITNRVITLFEQNNNSNEFYGFGMGASTLRYQVYSTSGLHAFYCSASSSASTELVRITASSNGSKGAIGINTTTIAAGLHVTGGVQNISGEDTCVRAESASSSAKIEYKCTAGTGKLYETRSTSSGTWDIIDRTASVEKLVINASGMGVGASAVAPTYDLDVNGTARAKKLLGNANAPTVSLGTTGIVGTGATSSVAGSELGGRFTLNTGTGLLGTGTIATFTLASAMPSSTFSIVLYPANSSANVSLIANSTSSTQFTLSNTGLLGLGASTTYIWNYQIVGY